MIVNRKVGREGVNSWCFSFGRDVNWYSYLMN